MIDVHCHLEQKEFEKDREKVVEKCKNELTAIINSACHPNDFDLVLKLTEKYKKFIFATLSVHPLYIKEISEKEIEIIFKKIETNKEKIVGIGETGLDYLVEEKKLQKKQKKLFLMFIRLAKELKKPLIIHCRRAFPDTIEILEKENCQNVLMHFFSQKEFLPRIIKNGWSLSVNTLLLKSKTIKKIVRDAPLEKIMTETDAPWLGNGKRNDPLSIKEVIEKIAEIKKTKTEEVDKITTQNAISFFNLPL